MKRRGPPQPSRVAAPGRSHEDTGRQPHRKDAGDPTLAAPPLPTWRDPWAWASLLALIPLVLHSLGAPLGEPFADDFDYLVRVLLQGVGSWLDGGGAVVYWRPIARQAYFGLMGGAITAHPFVVPVLHATLLGATTLLLYRAFRRSWSGSWSAGAASFVLLGESTRMLLAWPSIFQDVGALFFMALAVHETAHRRLWSTLLAILASLLCKEVAVLAALTLPWLPVPDRAPGERRRWALGVVTTLALWAGTYVLVTRRAGLALGYDAASAAPPVSVVTKGAWALWRSTRAQLSLPVNPVPWESAVAIALVVLLGATAWRCAVDPIARRRLRHAAPWVGWGVAWFLAGVAPIAQVHPAWAPYRAAFGGVGLGVALLAVIAPLGHRAIAGLVLLRLATFIAAPGPPARITTNPPEAGAALDFPKLVRLERLTRETRLALAREFPTLPRGARVVQRYLPLMAEYAFDHDHGIQTWTRDSTARWIRFEHFVADLDMPVTAVVEFQPRRTPPIAMVDADAVRAMFAGIDRANLSDWTAALREFERSDSLQRHRDADVFIAMVMGKRAWVLGQLGRRAEAERYATEALRLWPESIDMHFLFAEWRYRDGRYAEADSFIGNHLRLFPDDREAEDLRRRIRAAER